MRTPLMSFAIASLGFATAAHAVSASEFRDQLIAETQGDKNTDDHTCRRVREFGKGKVTDERCRAQLESVNSQCRDVAREHIAGVSSQTQAENLVGILMMCPIAVILELPFKVRDGKIGVKWSDLPQ